ncbi:MAG: hypothetical protein R3176_02785 [Woeseiaceae bacterium]|nr:hypothetical protein [Woeseiaceae bacterium]
MTKLVRLILPVLLAGVIGAANAQNLDMEGATPRADGDRPTRGMTAARVEQTFGTPSSKVAPVGDPPISRWEYPGYVVYFEYDKVIHAVVKR